MMIGSITSNSFTNGEPWRGGIVAASALLAGGIALGGVGVAKRVQWRRWQSGHAARLYALPGRGGATVGLSGSF